MVTKDTEDWKGFFDAKAQRAASDFEYDRGVSPRRKEIERLATEELLEFVDPQPWETVFDAGCGSGSNIFLLHSRVHRVIGMDYCDGAVDRCERRLGETGINNVSLLRGDLTSLPLLDNSVDKILCMSVLQYLTDERVARVFAEFVRILKDGGTLILHVKNITSLYLATLAAVKKAKLLLGMKTKLEHFRSYNWYVKQLQGFGFHLVQYNSFNLFTIESMPADLVQLLEKLELKYRNSAPLQLSFVRRRGSELKLKARLTKTTCTTGDIAKRV